MAKRRKTGPIARDVRNLCYAYLDGNINDDEYKSKLREIVNKYGKRYQSIGMAIRKRVMYSDEEKAEKIWKLTDEVEPRIKKAFENWAEKTMKTIGESIE